MAEEKKSIFTLFPDYESRLGDWYKVEKKRKDKEEIESEAIVPYFGAGFLRDKDPSTEGYYHGDIEKEALLKLDFTILEIYKVYYGNWLRDFSQLIVPLMVRPPDDFLEKIKQRAKNSFKDKIISNFYFLLFTQEGWARIMELFAIKEFVYNNDKNKVPNFMLHIKKFKQEYGTLDKDVLGIYRPEEHIDNPKYLKDDSFYEYIYSCYRVDKNINSKNLPIKFLYRGEIEKSLYIDTLNHKINSKPSGLKYFISEDIDKIQGERVKNKIGLVEHTPIRQSSKTFFQEQLLLAIQYGRNTEGLRYLGSALHVLEDYYAHSNYSEILLISLGQKDVYPCIDKIEETNFEYDCTKKDEEFNKRLVCINDSLNNFQNRAAHIPIVTGYFDFSDMFASFLPKVADEFFSVSFEEYKESKSGDRTFADRFIITILEERIKSVTKLNEQPRILGFTYAQLLQNYNLYLDKLDKYRKWKENNKWFYPITLFERFFHYFGEGFKIYQNIAINILLEGTDDIIKLYQNNIPKIDPSTKIGTDPSHTQIAKDDKNHPLNILAGKLAVEAVYNTVLMIMKRWKVYEKPRTNLIDSQELDKKLILNIANLYFAHPLNQNFETNREAMELKKIAEEFIKKYPKKVEAAHSKDIIEHTENEIKKVDLTTYEKKFKEIIDYITNYQLPPTRKPIPHEIPN